MNKVLHVLLCLLCTCLLNVSSLEAGASRPHHGRRLIALGAPAVEFVCALGMAESLIARSVWDMFPPEVQRLPSVGDPFQPDVERILSLSPELILTDGRFGRMEERMKPLGIEVFPVEGYHPFEVIPAIRRLTKRLGCEQKGEELVAELEALKFFVSRKLAGLPSDKRLSGIMLTDSNELFCVATESGNTFLEDAGAVNLASGLGHPFPLLSREWLAVRRPDFVLVPMKEGRDVQREIQMLRQKLGALLPSHCRIIAIEEGVTFGLRSFLGILKLASELYPACFVDVEFAEKKAAFMQDFFPHGESGGPSCP